MGTLLQFSQQILDIGSTGRSIGWPVSGTDIMSAAQSLGQSHQCVVACVSNPLGIAQRPGV